MTQIHILLKKILFLLPVLFISCTEIIGEPSAQEIVSKAIATQCQGNCATAVISFNFRDRQYESKRNNGAYVYTRITNDSAGTIKDKLTNYGFERTFNDSIVTVADSMATRYGNSVNSVIYFAQLPYGLDAPAAQKKYLGVATIKDQPYYEIEVTFKEEGGGTDFDDVFVYWIHQEHWTVDFLAYSYQVNGGGIRFREAYNARRVGGIRFVDYNNYKPENLNVELANLDELFTQGKLQLLSKIETENIDVKLP